MAPFLLRKQPECRRRAGTLAKRGLSPWPDAAPAKPAQGVPRVSAAGAAIAGRASRWQLQGRAKAERLDAEAEGPYLHTIAGYSLSCRRRCVSRAPPRSLFLKCSPGERRQSRPIKRIRLRFLNII